MAVLLPVLRQSLQTGIWGTGEPHHMCFAEGGDLLWIDRIIGYAKPTWNTRERIGNWVLYRRRNESRWSGLSLCRHGCSRRDGWMNRDFVEMLSALSATGAEFSVVGAHALAAHGLPRATGDLDMSRGPVGDRPPHELAIGSCGRGSSTPGALFMQS